jgi:hypothetical protein
MAKAVDRNAGSEVQITAAIFTDQMAVIAANRPEGGPGINRHQWRNRHGEVPLSHDFCRKFEMEKRKRQMAAPKGPPFARVYALAGPRSNTGNGCDRDQS